MNSATSPWNRLSLSGKIILPLIAVLVLGTLGFVFLWVVGVGPWVLNWVIDTGEANIDILRFLAAVTGILLFTIPAAFLIIFMELKLIAAMNLRIGPNRVGPWGTLSSTIHGLKVLAKEDFTPTGVDVPVYTLAPAVVYLAAVLTLMVIPFAPGMLGYEMELGLLYFFAIGGLGVIGLMMAGWSSYNKYSLLGGLRAAAGLISYELPLVLGVMGIVMLAGTLNLGTIVENQSGGILNWYVFQQPLALIIFFIAATAEASRTPFDFTEADSEIVAGFATEYSGMRFGFFFFAEYVNVFILSALTVTLFFGGWNGIFDIDPLLSAIGVATPVSLALDLGSLGPWLLAIPLLVPPVVTLVFGGLLWMLNSSWGLIKSLVLGFVMANLLLMGAVTIWALFSFEALMGIAWFMGKTFALVAIFVLMRATFPRVRIDQLMSFAWKWMMPAALVNIFVTAAAMVIVAELAS
ncbi:MAG: NADH-quinone oxidoreductase subunit H [Chloroflexota bacterium]